jgi:hypothetical protein
VAQYPGRPGVIPGHQTGGADHAVHQYPLGGTVDALLLVDDDNTDVVIADPNVPDDRLRLIKQLSARRAHLRRIGAVDRRAVFVGR